MNPLPWYKLNDEGEVDSPAVLVFRDRVEANIDELIRSIDRVERLRPHVKTHKSGAVMRMMIDKGITKFKCATIPEAEVLAESGATDVLLAYQPVGPKAKRLLELVQCFPQTKFSCLLDNITSAKVLSGLFSEAGKTLPFYYDINVGMNRTGIAPEDVSLLDKNIKRLPGLHLEGLHAYDGHLRDADVAIRKSRSDEAFLPVIELLKEMEAIHERPLALIAGGTPTFPVHAIRKDVECSPGTFIYWDKGYETILPEQKYLHAALVMCRVISKPADDLICVDLGHKSVASENALNQRVEFLDAPGLEVVGHSEEHMVLKNTRNLEFSVGDVLYGIPYHVCPTIALYERTYVVTNHSISDIWLTLSRNRKISV
jgi:D-threonine aldolase